KAAGCRIPEDVALVGFDDIEVARYMDPPLATVRQGFGALAEVGTDVLLDTVLEGKPLPATARVPTTFIPRHSCGCVSYTANTVALSVPPSEDGRALRLRELLVKFFRQHTQVTFRVDPERAWPSVARLAEHVVSIVEGGAGHDVRGMALVWREFLG